MDETLAVWDIFAVQFFWILVVIGLGVVFYFIARSQAKRRRLAIAEEAKRLGLDFEADSTEGWAKRCGSIRTICQGSRPRAQNVVRGQRRGREVRCFDFTYYVQSGKSGHDVTVGVAVAILSRVWPKLSIDPEHAGHKIWDALGGDDIDFESEEFSRLHWVQSDDRRFAYDVLHPRQMEHVMAPGWDRWRSQGNVLLLWTRRRHSPDEIEPALDRLLKFLDLVPPHVSQRLAERAETTAPTA